MVCAHGGGTGGVLRLSASACFVERLAHGLQGRILCLHPRAGPRRQSAGGLHGYDEPLGKQENHAAAGTRVCQDQDQ